MFHLVDAVATWGMTLIGGLHVTEHFDPKSFAASVRTHKVTQTALPPTLLDMVLRHGIEPRRLPHAQPIELWRRADARAALSQAVVGVRAVR